ncbi:hypothetical protein M2271_006246 [Streptomyces sp. LBL]|uniref:hypothetical protein n=1 Tax=Streptomyces sp. LBL TaxID=2940562 RepID=UPI002476DD93|nr:hypothetical protein [Streptomyces sp. LBL]MDH6628413.1 hypothetical protein [Streptomyces sp. LBL]
MNLCLTESCSAHTGDRAAGQVLLRRVTDAHHRLALSDFGFAASRGADWASRPADPG